MVVTSGSQAVGLCRPMPGRARGGGSSRGAGEGRLCLPKQLGERQEADGGVRAEAAAVWGRPYGAEG